MRKATLERKTTETNISLMLVVDGIGKTEITTGSGFLDHMLTLFGRHGGFDLILNCQGDSDVDFHHITEDIGICLGKAFSQALGDCCGITRYGNFLLPMDETLIMIALDICGRAFLGYHVLIPASKVGDFDTELVQEFLMGFCRSLGLTLHVRQLAGTNSHHLIEAIFKGLAMAMKQAVSIDCDFPNEIPSTKGVLF